MNGIHDLGGMDGFGPIEYEADEPPFHESWEARIFAINMACRAWGKWTLDRSRYTREQLSPLEFLRDGYWERTIGPLETLLIEAGMITREELDRRIEELRAAGRA
jgi:nitrile hydratase